jgi:hypothetical protein
MGAENEGHRCKPIIQRIYDEFFVSLEASPDFDGSILRRLRALTMEGEMKKHRRVSEVIAGTAGNKDETPRA